MNKGRPESFSRMCMVDNANSTIFSTLYLVSDCLARLATASERKSSFNKNKTLKVVTLSVDTQLTLTTQKAGVFTV